MKNSGIEWIGEIPDDWRTIKVKYVLTANDGGIWGNDPLNLESDKIVLRSTEQTVDGLWNITNPATRDLSHLSYSRFIIKSGDLLMTKSSGSKAHIGKTTLAGAFFDRHECYYSNFIQRLRLNNQSSPKYFWYIFNSIFTREQFVYLQNSTSGIGNINSDNIRSIVIPFITLQDQQKIADFLDKKCAAVDRLIENQRAQIEKLKEYKQSVITEAVTRGLAPSAPLKDSGVEWIGKIPENFNIRKLKSICKIFGRIGFRGYRQDDLVEEGEGAITISPSNMRDAKMDYSKCTYLSWGKYYESPEIQIKKGDILFVKTGSTYGKIALVSDLPMEATINPQLVVLKNFNAHNSYLCYFLQTYHIQSQVKITVVGGTIPTIAQDKISRYDVIVPPLEEQQQIADYLDKKCAEIDKLISIKQQKIETLTEYKKSLIYEYVTGKKEVVS